MCERPILGEEMIGSFNYALQRGQINITQSQGIIKVITKKKKGKSYPIKRDYKIATETIAHRIVTFLPDLISEDQTGYVKGRYIGQNIRVITTL